MPELDGSVLVCPKCKKGERVVFIKAIRYFMCTDCNALVGFEVLEEEQPAPSTT